MTPLLCSLCALARFSKTCVESEGQSFPLSFGKIFSFALPSSLPCITRERKLGLAVSGSPRDAFQDREWLAKDYHQARSSQRPAPQRSGCGYSESLGSRSSWVPRGPESGPKDRRRG